MLIQAHKIMFLGSFDPQTLFFYYRDPQKVLRCAETRVLAINGRDRSSDETCGREQEYKKIEHKK